MLCFYCFYFLFFFFSDFEVRISKLIEKNPLMQSWSLKQVRREEGKEGFTPGPMGPSHNAKNSSKIMNIIENYVFVRSKPSKTEKLLGK